MRKFFAVIHKNAQSPASVIRLPGPFPFHSPCPLYFCITNVRPSRSSWFKLLVIPIRVLRRQISSRLDHTGVSRFLLQFLHHSALKTPFISKIKQVLKFITFFQSESSKRHFIGYPAPLIHIVGIIGGKIAPIPVIHISFRRIPEIFGFPPAPGGTAAFRQGLVPAVLLFGRTAPDRRSVLPAEGNG